MKIIHQAKELEPGFHRVCAAIGVFDGVHLGHQQVIRQTIADARQHEAVALVVTFDCHPNVVVAPDRVPLLVYSLPQKLRVIGGLGADTTLLIHFDDAFSRIPAEDFIRSLAHDLGQICSLCVGHAFTFGHKRSGNVELLTKLGRELKFIVHGLASISLDGQAVSSTRIREAIRSGNLDAASQMLGRSYSLSGQVVRGDELGRKLGFPTANLDVTGLVLPPPGVYAVHAQVDQTVHRAVVNLGYRPTLRAPVRGLQVEAHLLDFDGNLYGQEMEITFVEKLREEQKFPSPEALVRQIASDIDRARQVFD
jgi:riboflavin kinase / FMN adenylyltransferase